jgi:hypothetical protein
MSGHKSEFSTETRKLPRVSTATGGPLLHIDLDDFSALPKMDDLEYVERMRHFK